MDSGVAYSGRANHALVFLCLLLAGSSSAIPSTALYAQSRVSDYVVEEFDGEIDWSWSNFTYLGWGDNVLYSVTMPFEFSFDGQKVAQGSPMRVSTNGWIQFTLPGHEPNGSGTTFNLLGNSAFQNTLAIFASDVFVWNGLYYKVSGKSPDRVMTFFYRGVKNSTHQASADMQVNLYESNGQIEYIYSSAAREGLLSAATAGIGLNGHVLSGFQSRAIDRAGNGVMRNIRMRPSSVGISRVAHTTADDLGKAPNALAFTPAQLQGLNDMAFVSTSPQSYVLSQSGASRSSEGSANAAAQTATTGPASTHGYTLGQNYPNPAQQSSTIGFTMAQAGHAKIVVSDLAGNSVATVADGYFSVGENSVQFDASVLTSGTYVYELVANDVRLSRSLMVSE